MVLPSSNQLVYKQIKMASRPTYPGTPPPSGVPNNVPQRYPGPQGGPGGPIRFSQQGYQVEIIF